MLKEFQHRTNKFQSQTIVVGCSGGVDSMVLLHLFHTLKFKLHVVHVNYKKRGQASESDEELVRNYCEENKIPCSISEFDSELYPTGNFQENARNFRYEKMLVLKNDYPNSKIALAHHSDDQVETFFMNLARKAGILGFACMQEENDSFIRPLLSFTKEEISAFAIENKIPWREDKSNESNDYQRNKWRNEFLPFLNKSIPTIEESVLFLIEKFQEKQASVEVEATDFLDKITQDQILLDSELLSLDEFLKFELWRQLGQIASTFEAFNKIHLLQKGKKIELIGTYSAILKEDKFIQFVVEKEVKSFKDELVIRKVSEFPNSFTKEKIYLNPDKIRGELKLRPWENGDKIASLGMKGKQLVSDIIKDAKVHQKEKKEVLVLCDDGEIHWVVGLKIGRVAVASEQDNTIWEIFIADRLNRGL